MRAACIPLSFAVLMKNSMGSRNLVDDIAVTKASSTSYVDFDASGYTTHNSKRKFTLL